LDADTFKPAAGGINKDSGYYLFSPHADLHLTAAMLAINHSEYFFNQIRNNVGDTKFNTFLSILVSPQDILAAQNLTLQTCSSLMIKPFSLSILGLVFFTVWLI
jgi:hypothetical protein